VGGAHGNLLAFSDGLEPQALLAIPKHAEELRPEDFANVSGENGCIATSAQFIAKRLVLNFCRRRDEIHGEQSCGDGRWGPVEVGLGPEEERNGLGNQRRVETVTARQRRRRCNRRRW
jgi:hypothetical protein